ncbi:MAG: type II secretion system GspH family protein [Akkermansiaceae bacterium]|nr:type II secretion system GspH family protein [Akkermansiaceae bacterium]MCF7733690.1 type II secretion system GspH family protein [Akkermansiaceae bacterium]
MKSTSHPPTKRQSGMTLIEMTVVILVLLALIAVIFIGSVAWKRGSDRAACILNIRNVQQAIRGHQNIMEKAAGDPIVWTQIIGDQGYLQLFPVCPSDGIYQPVATYPVASALAYPCNVAVSLNHTPMDTAGW